MSFSPIYVASMSERPVINHSSNRFYIPEKERGQLLTEKGRHRKELQSHYGKDWKKHLNIPGKGIEKPIHITF